VKFEKIRINYSYIIICIISLYNYFIIFTYDYIFIIINEQFILIFFKLYLEA